MDDRTRRIAAGGRPGGSGEPGRGSILIVLALVLPLVSSAVASAEISRVESASLRSLSESLARAIRDRFVVAADGSAAVRVGETFRSPSPASVVGVARVLGHDARIDLAEQMLDLPPPIAG